MSQVGLDRPDPKGTISELTPPARAARHTSERIESTAIAIATRADEQAVSTIRLGPRKSSKYDKRLARMLLAPPVLKW